MIFIGAWQQARQAEAAARCAERMARDELARAATRPQFDIELGPGEYREVRPNNLLDDMTGERSGRGDEPTR